MRSVPPEMPTRPWNVLAPLRIIVPVPALKNCPPSPDNVPEKVVLLLSPPTVNCGPPNAPPTRIEAIFTVPEPASDPKPSLITPMSNVPCAPIVIACAV